MRYGEVDEYQLLPVLSKKYDAALQLDHYQAEALFHSLKFYLRLLLLEPPLYPAQAQSIRPMHRLMLRLEKLLQGDWSPVRKKARQRKCKVEFDALLQLNALLREGELFPAQFHYTGSLNAVHLQVNQQAQNLTGFFQL
ncbi:hypothetical protein LJY25_08280 [Hymenobacter sp. BT175]|uniref:hypothetical protein n=1 Tax=Hymenobacter translucens TaxID=2886507 RepID=UPI001D0EC596|nr:hypothetical protein [Hymenobacter translucens]MCC2546439.1 hypothetical protein [Hymenobacter translucens]